MLPLKIALELDPILKVLASVWYPKSNHRKYVGLYMIKLYEVKISKQMKFTSKEKENACNKISLL
jgi:hypothetical protein